MRYRQRSPKHFLIALLAISCLTGALAPSASASGEWWIGGEQLEELEPESAPLLGSATESFELEIPWYATTITCNTLSVPSGTLTPGGKSEATLKLSKCSLSGPPFVAETCEMTEPLELEVKGQLVEHGGKFYDLLEGAETGKRLGTIKFKEGTECPLPLSNELTGTFLGTTESIERVKQPLAFNEAVEKLFGSDRLKFGTHPASLAGKTSLDLGGKVYEGEKWAAKKYVPPPPPEPEGEPEFGGQFWVNGEVLTGEVSFAGYTGEGALLLEELELELHCNSATLSGVLNENGTASGNALFEGCAVNNVFCTIYPTEEDMEEETNKGQIFAAGSGELALWGGRHFFVVKSVSTLYYYAGIFCSFPEEIELNGSLSVELPNALEEVVTHLPTTVTAGLENMLGTGMYYGAYRLTVDEGATVAGLTGEYEGESWSAE